MGDGKSNTILSHYEEQYCDMICDLYVIQINVKNYKYFNVRIQIALFL